MYQLTNAPESISAGRASGTFAAGPPELAPPLDEVLDAPDEAAPDDEAPDEAAPDDEAPEDEAPDDEASEEEAPEDDVAPPSLVVSGTPCGPELAPPQAVAAIVAQVASHKRTFGTGI